MLHKRQTIKVKNTNYNSTERVFFFSHISWSHYMKNYRVLEAENGKPGNVFIIKYFLTTKVHSGSVVSVG